MRLRIAEIGENAVPHVLGDEATSLADLFGAAAVIGTDNLAHVLGIEPRGERRRVDEVAEQNRELPAFGTTSTALVPLGCTVPIDLLGRRHRFAPQRRNRVKQSPAVTNHADTEVFQVLGSQLRQYLAIDSVLAERRLILFEAQLSQPACDVHPGASTAMCRNDQTG